MGSPERLSTFPRDTQLARGNQQAGSLVFCSQGLNSDFISLMLSKGQSQAQLPSREQMACQPFISRNSRHSRVSDAVSSIRGPLEWLPFFVSGCDGSQAGVGALHGELSGSCSGQGACQGYPLKPTLGLEQLGGPSPTISWELHHPQLLGWGQEAAWAPLIGPQGFPAVPDPKAISSPNTLLPSRGPALHPTIMSTSHAKLL